MTAREALKRGETCLAEAGWEDGPRAASLLLEGATGLSGMAFIGMLDTRLADAVSAAYLDMVRRAASGEPVQYILGHWDFYGRVFKTDSRALIPRPETELLVESMLKTIPQGDVVSVMDAGCGTGCIGITVKLKRPSAQVTLCDVSAGALALANENAGLLGADVAFVLADMRSQLPGGPYDIIVSNPPYINGRDMDGLSPVVRNHEPHLALYGGEDGLDFIRALADRAGDSLAPGGRLFIEVGYDQAERALELMVAAGLAAEALPDYSGILRIVMARKG